MGLREEVAKRAGVSVATVSRVLNNKGPVRPETRRRVLEAARALDYHPDASARSLARRRTSNLGVVVPYIPGVHLFSKYYFAELLSGIGAAAKAHGYNVMLFFRDLRRPEDWRGYFQGRRIDACIFLGARVEDDPQLRALKSGTYLFLLINHYLPGEDINFADVDNVRGAELATAHLLALGHRCIAFLNGPPNYINSRDREEGYRRALAAAGLPFRPELVLIGNYSRGSGARLAPVLLERQPRPTAVFCANDLMAVGLLAGLRERGVQVPAEMAIVGYDDAEIASLVHPALTTVRVPFFELGKQAAARLLEQGDAGREPIRLLFPPELVVRESTMKL